LKPLPELSRVPDRPRLHAPAGSLHAHKFSPPPEQEWTMLARPPFPVRTSATMRPTYWEHVCLQVLVASLHKDLIISIPYIMVQCLQRCLNYVPIHPPCSIMPAPTLLRLQTRTGGSAQDGVRLWRQEIYTRFQPQSHPPSSPIVKE
jgi:hypothetical protein